MVYRKFHVAETSCGPQGERRWSGGGGVIMGSMGSSQKSVCGDFFAKGSRCVKGDREIAMHFDQGDLNLVSSGKVTLCWGGNSVVLV